MYTVGGKASNLNVSLCSRTNPSIDGENICHSPWSVAVKPDHTSSSQTTTIRCILDRANSSRSWQTGEQPAMQTWARHALVEVRR
jgi:hypothetical protein